MSRPGVATRRSTPARNFLNCSVLLTPPKTAEHRIGTPALMNLCVSFAICVASSRVGARTSARGPSRFPARRRRDICAKAGNKNANVFPLPVFAHANTSRPLVMTGKHCACTPVGLSNPNRFNALSASTSNAPPCPNRVVGAKSHPSTRTSNARLAATTSSTDISANSLGTAYVTRVNASYDTDA